MRLATNYDRIHGAGAELAAVSVDDDVRQAGMAERWGFTHTAFVSDPGGEQILAPLGLFDPEERGGIALPGMVIIAPDGTEVYRYQGRDFADRTNDDDLWAALEALDLPAVDVPPWTTDVEVPEDLARFFRPTDFGPYFRGNRFAAVAIGGRLPDKETAAIAREHRMMADASLEAWDEHRKQQSGG
ncbi:MAG: hypothetical protein AAF547_04495 [Actinomycetota bacterium]